PTSVHTIYSHLFFLTATATTEIYTLSLHDALPIFQLRIRQPCRRVAAAGRLREARRVDDVLRVRTGARAQSGVGSVAARTGTRRSEEHTSELQSLAYLVCRLLLEKKKKKQRSVTLP